MQERKIIGIGFHKTGITSLKTALELLGYDTVKGRQVYNENTITYKESIFFLKKQNYSLLLDLLNPYEAIVDNPWNILFKEIDSKFPNSKFILTLREEKSWLSSAKKHFVPRPDTMIREWIYGVSAVADNESTFLERYKRHNQLVLDYFKDRPDDLLIVNWKDGDGWKELCSFLDKPVINLPFPQFNKSIK